MSVVDLVSPRVLVLALCCPLLSVGLAGCGGETEVEEDAGGIARRDAGSRVDAGSLPVDAGSTPQDAGTASDAGQAADAGEAVDAGEATDAGSLEHDAGIEPDAGSIEHDAGVEPDAGSLEHDAGIEPDAGSIGYDAGLSVCGDGVCASDEDCGSCADDCTCPVIEFTFPAWEETASAPLVAGGHAKVRYNLDRLTTCRSTHNGNPGWSMTFLYKFGPTDAPQEAMLSMSGQPFEPVIDIPADATQLITWIRNADVSGCEAWDSNYGANYVFPVTAP